MKPPLSSGLLRIRRRLPVAALVGLMLTPLAAEARQKNQIRFPTNDRIALSIQQADALIARKKIAEGLELYVKILEERLSDTPESILEIDPDTGKQLIRSTEEPDKPPLRFVPRRFRGVDAYVRDQLWALTPKQRELYRKTYDYRAEARLKEALERGLPELERFYRVYAVSSYGKDALQRIADLAMEAGRLGDAERSLHRLVRRHNFELDAATTLALQTRRLVCLMGLGRVAELNRLARGLGLGSADQRIDVGGRSRTLGELLEMAIAVRGRMDKARSSKITHMRGSPCHENATTAPLRVGRMVVGTTSFRRRGNAFSPSPPRPFFGRPARPQKVRNLTLPIVVNARRRVDGKFEMQPLALLSTGFDVKTLWLKDGASAPRVPFAPPRKYPPFDNKILHGGAWSGGIYVTNVLERINNAEDYKQIPIKVDIPIRKLCAISTRSWRVKWNHRNGLKDKEVAKASFPSSPVIVGDTVYASAIIIEGYVGSYVMAFDLQTGELKWKSWVCSGQVEQTMFGEHAREPMATSVAVKDGVVYHCSSLGVVAALDARSGAPLWMSSYEQIEIEAPRGYYPVPRSLRWANSPPIVAKDVLVVTPLDADIALGYDVVTGERLYRIDRRSVRSPGEYEYLVGAENGLLALSGPIKLGVYDLRTGKEVWHKSNFKGSTIEGRGVIANGELCFSMSSSRPGRLPPVRVTSFDITTGKQTRVQRVSGSAKGDLAVFDDAVIIIGNGIITAFENKEIRRRSRDF